MVENKYEKIVTFGCSLSKDNYQDVWTDVLSERINAKLINYAERGAGYSFISDMLVKNIDNLKDSLCVIMWPSCDRFDLWVNDETPHLQKELKYASWLDGKTPKLCDLNGVYNDTVGYHLSGAVPRGIKHVYYKYFYSQESHVNDAWKTIIMTQSFLAMHAVEYIMCSSYPLMDLTQYHVDAHDVTYDSSFLSQIDLSKFVDDSLSEGFIQFAKREKSEFFNAHYPKTRAHDLYVDKKILPLLNKFTKT